MKLFRASHGSICALLMLATAGAAPSCAPSESAGPGGGGSGKGGSSSGTGNGGSGQTTTGAGGSSATTGAGGGFIPTTGAGGSMTTTTTGAGGAGGAAQKACFTEVTPMNPVLLDFENYNGMTAVADYGAPFGGASADTGNAYAGFYTYGDGSATPDTEILAGRPPSMWGLSEKITQASTWGMAGGFWMGCANLTGFKGVSFWVRGTSATALFSFGVVMESTAMPDANNPAGGGTCTGTADTCKPAMKENLTLSSDWSQIQIMWADFAPGMSNGTAVTANGDKVVGFVWNVPLQYMLAPGADPSVGPYNPVPGDLTINFDDVQFIP